MSRGISKQLDIIQKSQQILQLKQYKLLEKAMASDNPSDILKANNIIQTIENRDKSDKKSYVVDPYEFQGNFGYKDRQNGLSYAMLKNMAKTPIINAVIRTRINQIASFAEPQRDRYSIGYIIRKRKTHTSQQVDKLSLQEEKEIEFLYNFIENCGINNSWEADDFDSFMRKITRDSLTYDQCCFEVVRNRKGEPIELIAGDASTYRVATSYDDDNYNNNNNGEEPRQKIKGYYPSFVQLYQQKTVAEFYPWELSFGVRNPSTEVHMNGYGISELEEMVSIVTALLWGEDYNRRFFKQGSAPKGLLKVSGSFNDTKLQEFRQQWNATMRGVQNAWKTPILEADKVDWVDLQRSNRDMEFSNWMEFLIKISCAIYSIDPAEVNFPLSGGASQQAMFEGNNEARLSHSKDKGLYPLLKFFQKRLNKFVISQYFEGKYEFLFQGLDAMTPKQEMELTEKEVKTFKTVNEVRRDRGMDDLEGGDMILDSTMQNAKNQSAQQELANSQHQMDQQAFENEQNQAEQGGEETEKSVINPFEKSFNEYFDKLNTPT